MARRLILGDEARARLLRGIDAVADAVAVTMGPAGRHVLLDRPGEAPRVTRDGATVAEAIEMSDRAADLGLRIMRRAAATAAEATGDGSTTATVLARAMARHGLTMQEAGANPTELRRGIGEAVDAVLTELEARTRRILAPEDLARVAAVAANGDAEAGRLVALAMDRVGPDGVISVEAGDGVETVLDHLSGMRFDQGYVSPYFMTDPETARCELQDPFVLVCEEKLDRHEPLLRVLEASVRARKPLLVIAEDIGGEALQTLVTSKVKGGLRIAAAKAPLFGYRRAAILADIALVTGGRLVSERLGGRLAEAGPEVLGRARRAVLTRTETTIVGGCGGPEAIARRCDEIRTQIAKAGSAYERTHFRERLARLRGGVAIIRTGGATATEIAERRQRIESAASAARAAVAEGILPGGGAALFHAAGSLSHCAPADADRRSGIAIVRRALQAPLRRIVANAGGDPAAVAAELETAAAGPDFGYDARAGRCRDLYEAGVVDAAGVVRAALISAASVAGLLIATGAVVVRLPEPPPLPLDQRPFGPESPDMLPEDLNRHGLA